MVGKWLDAYEFVYDLLADPQYQTTDEGKLAGSNSVKWNDLPVGAGDENIGVFGGCCSPVGAHLDVLHILHPMPHPRVFLCTLSNKPDCKVALGSTPAYPLTR